MKKIGRMLFSLLLTFVTLAGGMAYQPSTALAEGEVPVSITPDAISVAAGYNFPVKVDIGDVTEFHAAQYDIYFNPAVLSIVDITPGNIAGVEIPLMMNEIESGHYRVEQDLGTDNVTGAGFLSMIHFHAIQNGTSSVNLSSGLMSSIDQGPIAATWTNGAVTVEDITMVDVNPSVSEVHPGDDFTINLNISEVSDLLSVQYDIHFDPAVMTLTDIDSGTVGGTEITVNGTNGMRELVPGHWRIVQITDINDRANGTGNLATIHFHAVQLGSSPIDISDGMIAGLYADIPATWLPGTVQIVEVTKNLTGITISPLDYTMDTGQTVQYTATGTYDDSSQDDITATVTWNSTNTNVATISASGMASATTTPGTTTISATKGGYSASTGLTTEKADLVSIAVSPLNTTLTPGMTQQYTATGTYADTSEENLTGSVQWFSSNEAVATISTSGLATTHAEGTTNITAQLGAVTSTPEAVLNVVVSTVIIVNDGETISLNPGQTVVAYSQVDDDTGFVESTGYRVRVENLPEFEAEDGLGTFDFLITWDPDVISVDNAVQYAGLAGWAVTPGAIDAEAGTMIINGFSGTNPRTTDTTLFYIGLTAATDNPGGTCELGITVVDFQDTTGEETGEIEPRIVIGAPVQIVTAQANTSITDATEVSGQDTIAFVAVNIDGIVNPANSSTISLADGLGSFEGQIATPDGDIEILGVAGTDETGTVTYNSSTGVFSVSSVASPMQPSNTMVAKIYVRLTGTALVKPRLQVTFTKIAAAGDPETNIASDGTQTMTFHRGNANEDDIIAVGDALRVARFKAGLEPITNIDAISSASVIQDIGVADGDLIKVGDALAIAQYKAELRDDYYQMYD